MAGLDKGGVGFDANSLRRELDDFSAKKRKLDQDYAYYRRHLQDLSVESDKVAKRIVEVMQKLNSFDVFVATRAAESEIRDRRHEQAEARRKAR